MAVAVPAIFCTVALPAYAASQGTTGTGSATAALQKLKTTGAQTVGVSADAAVTTAARDGYTATSAEELQRAALKASLASRGPSVRQLLANPPYPNFSLDTVVQVAMQYQGVPYVYGGASPAGFDCSGFTQYVYAQLGVYLPHSSAAQGRMTNIAPEAALPGDLVIMDGGSHVGIYLGGNMMIHAPYPGRTVSVQEIYTSNHWFVRVGI